MLKNWEFPDGRGRCLFLFMRHMGDTLIACGFLNALRRRYPEMTIDILGRPDLREVCERFAAFHEYIGVDLPVYGHHRRSSSDVRQATQTLLMVRRRKYDYCINLMGDLRENVIARLTGAKWSISPVWAADHLFARKITPGMSWISNRGIEVPQECSNYYDALNLLAARVGLGRIEWPEQAKERRAPGKTATIAIHPGGSHPSKHWASDKWKALMRELNLRDYRVILLGAPSERNYLLGEFEREIADCRIEVKTTDLSGLLASVSSADLLVGMDSFSVHVAHAAGVPVVVLHGSSELGVMNPPGSIELSAASLCDVFPCHYKYPCKDTEGAYRCVRGIETSAVISAVGALVRDSELLKQAEC